jgi:hypothetical protein
MFDEMSFDQKYDYGILQEKVTRSVQLKALQDGAKHKGKTKVRFGAGGKSINEPKDLNDVRNSVFETETTFGSKIDETQQKKEIELIDNFYDSLKRQGYTAQQIFDNPQLLNKFDETTKGSDEYVEDLIENFAKYRDPQTITKEGKSETMRILDKIGSEGDLEEIGPEKLNKLIFE